MSSNTVGEKIAADSNELFLIYESYRAGFKKIISSHLKSCFSDNNMVVDFNQRFLDFLRQTIDIRVYLNNMQTPIKREQSYIRSHRVEMVKQQIQTVIATQFNTHEQNVKRTSLKALVQAHRDCAPAYTQVDQSGLNPLIDRQCDHQRLKTQKYDMYTHFSHLYKIFLAAVHDVLWGQAVDNVAGVKYNQKKNHTEEEKSLWTSSLRSYFVQLKKKNMFICN